MNSAKTFYFLVLAFVLLTSQAQAAIKELRVGTEGAYFPFNYIDSSGKLKGFDIDIANAICADLKVPCKFVTQDWDGIIPGLISKKYDAIIASMSATEERKKHIAFTKQYYNTPARFVAKKGTNLILSPEGMKDKVIGVQRGTIHATFLEKKYKGIVKVKLYDTQENVNLDLVAGRVDAVLADSAVMYLWMQKSGGGKFDFASKSLDVGNKDIFGDGANIGLRKDDEELRLAINKSLDNIQKNGVYDKIRKNYFPFDIK